MTKRMQRGDPAMLAHVVPTLNKSFAHIMLQLDMTTPENQQALAELQTFCAVATRVMQKTNPSKLRECARAAEIAQRIRGMPVLED